MGEKKRWGGISGTLSIKWESGFRQLFWGGGGEPPILRIGGYILQNFKIVSGWSCIRVTRIRFENVSGWDGYTSISMGCKRNIHLSNNQSAQKNKHKVNFLDAAKLLAVKNLHFFSKVQKQENTCSFIILFVPFETFESNLNVKTNRSLVKWVRIYYFGTNFFGHLLLWIHW